MEHSSPLSKTWVRTATEQQPLALWSSAPFCASTLPTGLSHEAVSGTLRCRGYNFAMPEDHDEGKPRERDETDEEPAPRLCVTLMLRGAYKGSVLSKALQQARQVRPDMET